ncbi:TPA: hypothetical protein ACH3X1_004029 [Trebouxia sp. C0004]
MFYLAKKEATPAGSLKRPQDNSFLTQETYHCSYGPQDNRRCVPEVLTQKQPSQGNRASCAFPSGILNTQMHMAMLSMAVEQMPSMKHLHGPALSQTMKDWVRTSLWNGNTTQQILKQHAMSAMPRIDSNTADSDCFLNSQDIRNIAQKLGQLT